MSGMLVAVGLMHQACDRLEDTLRAMRRGELRDADTCLSDAQRLLVEAGERFRDEAEAA